MQRANLPERTFNRGKHALEVLKHLAVPEPQHPKPLALQPLSPRAIPRRAGRMLPAVNLNYQRLFKTDKVYHIPTNCMLTAKFVAYRRAIPQPRPQQLFCFR